MNNLFSKIHWTGLFLVGLVIFTFTNCEQDPKFEDFVPDYTYSIIRSFRANGLSTDIDHTNAVVTTTLPAGSDLAAVSVDIELPDGATVNPADGSKVDFSKGPVIFTVSNNGISRTYTVTVAAFGNPLIMTFSIGKAMGIIDQGNGTIDLTVGSQEDITKLTPQFTIPGGTTAKPESGVAQNFTNPVKYTVVSNDGFTGKSYFVTVNQIAAPKINKFSVNGLDATILESAKTIYLLLPAGTDLTKVSPVIEVPTGQTVSPKSAVSQDFSKGSVNYTVTNTEGLTKTYTVTVEVGSAPIAFIGEASDIASLKDDDAKAAAEFLKATYPNDFNYISFSNLSTATLQDMKVVVLYYLSPLPNLGYSATSNNVMSMLPPELQPGTLQSNALTKFVKNGGHLFVAGDPTPIVHVIGRVPADYSKPRSPGNYVYSEFGCGGTGGCVDMNKPADDIWGLGVRDGNNSANRRNHPIFSGLTFNGDGELYLQNSATREVRLVWWQHFDGILSPSCCGQDAALLFEQTFSAVKLGTLRWIGDAFGYGAVEYLPTSGNVHANFDFNIPTNFKGHIISLENTIIGYEFDSNGTKNDYQGNIKRLTTNIVDYLKTL